MDIIFPLVILAEMPGYDSRISNSLSEPYRVRNYKSAEGTSGASPELLHQTQSDSSISSTSLQNGFTINYKLPRPIIPSLLCHSASLSTLQIGSAFHLSHYHHLPSTGKYTPLRFSPPPKSTHHPHHYAPTRLSPA